MQVRFVLGPAGSGKTFRCLAEIRAALRENPWGDPLVLLAPKQATFQLERQLLAGGPIAGYARLHILSFERLAHFCLAKLRLAPPRLLSEEGRVMILRALLQRHADDLKLFYHSARRPGFAEALSTLLTELQQHLLTPSRLCRLAENRHLRPGLRDKLHDLALLAGKYADWLQERHLHDAHGLLDFVAEALRRQAVPGDSPLAIQGIWLDGFAEMTPQELDLLAAVAPFCRTVTAAFCLDEPAAGADASSWLSIWNTVGHTFQQCRRRLEDLSESKMEIEVVRRDPRKSRFANNPALAFLEKAWAQGLSAVVTPALRPEGIALACAAHPEAEAQWAAREVLKFVRAGHRFRDCAVLVRHLEDYHQPLARTFRRYEIPFFLDRRESVAHHPLAELTRGVVRMAAFDWRQEDWFAVLKTGFCAVAEEQIDELENAALEFGWRGRQWREPLPDEKFERLRRRLVSPFERFWNTLAAGHSPPTGAQLAAALRDLWGALGVEQTLEGWSAGPPAGSPFPPFNPAMHAAVFDQMNAWLDNLALGFSDQALSLRDWLPVLESGLARLTVGVIPPVLYEVLIGAVDRTRNPDLKFVLVLGANEGVFPAAPAPAAILTEADRQELPVVLGPDARRQLARERYYGYIATTRAAEKLAVTFARCTADGRTLNPSPFIAQLREIFPSLEITAVPNEIIPADAEHAAELTPWLAKICRLPERPPGLQKLLEVPVLKSLAGQFAEWREPEGRERLSPALAEKLYGPALQTSVSRLEEFAQCPFRFFMRVGLRADERKRFELDARERGNFQHVVLKQFHEQLAAEQKRWRDLTPAEARERIARIAAAEREQFRAGLLRDSPETLFAAEAMSAALQDFIEVLIGWMRGQYQFDPAAAELDFGGEKSPDTALEIQLENGRKLALHGRMDRVDLWHQPAGSAALAVVMDYKSGDKKPDAVLMAHGIQLQLPAYLAALRRWKNPRPLFGADRLIPAGAFYVNLRGSYESGQTREEILEDAEARQRAYRHRGRFDAGALDQLDSQKKRDQFQYRLTDAGELHGNSTEALPRAEFEKWLEAAEERMREMGNAIFSGEASVDPYRKNAETACDFCSYRAACRIDPWSHSWRALRTAKKGVS